MSKKSKPKPPADPSPRTALLQIRLTPDEYAVLEAVACVDDRPLSTWARRQLLIAAAQQKPPA